MQQLRRAFLCYAKEDRAAVTNLYERLHQSGINAWIDHRDLTPGANWKSVILREIRQADVFVACLSQFGVQKKGFVHQEIREALEVLTEHPEGSIYLIPVMLAECEIPEKLKMLHVVKAFEEDGFSKLVRAIKKAAVAGDDTDSKDRNLVERSDLTILLSSIIGDERVIPYSGSSNGLAYSILESPTAGRVYLGPSPKKPPFVRPGQSIDPLQPLCILEAMKQFTTIESQAGGVVTRILVRNGAMVRKGQALFVISAATETRGSADDVHECHAGGICDQYHLQVAPGRGTIYRAEDPEADPIVGQGDKVSKGQSLALLEAMKKYRYLEAEVEGVVSEILFENGQQVDRGEALFLIGTEPLAGNSPATNRASSNGRIGKKFRVQLAPVDGVFHLYADFQNRGRALCESDVVREEELVGHLDSTEGLIDVRAEFAGEIVRIVASDGQRVASGDVLLQTLFTMIGAAFRVQLAPESGEFTPAVKRGDRVSVGDTIGMLAARSATAKIRAEHDGVILDVCAEEGEMVPQGQLLFKFDA